MSGYTKLFSSILGSTVWREPNHVRIVWITMLALADRRGVVEASVPGLADLARVSRRHCEQALERLHAVDPDSRSPAEAGRRLRLVPGGWQIVNYGAYRLKMNADERREYQRMKAQEYRDRDKGRVDTASTNGDSRRQSSTPVDTVQKQSTEEDQEQRARARKTPATHRLSPHHLRAGHPKGHWFCGRNFCVSYLQHDLLERELGAHRGRVNLDELYPRWDAGDPQIDNLLPWLKARIADEIGRQRRVGPGSSQASDQARADGDARRDAQAAEAEDLARQIVALMTDEERQQCAAEAKAELKAAGFWVRVADAQREKLVADEVALSIRQGRTIAELRDDLARRKAERTPPAAQEA